MTTEFTTLGLNSQLEQAISDLGYITPTQIQSQVIPLLLSGRDVIGQAQTGTGKTAAFLLPIMQTLEIKQPYIKALVLSPTRELCLQVAKVANDFGRGMKIRVLAVYGGQPYNPQINSLKQGVDIVVGTPGRLLDLIEKGVLDLSHARTVVIDEADEMLSMGFIEDIKTIFSKVPAERQTALFSATISPGVRSISKKYMKAPHSVSIAGEHLTVDAIDHRYYLVNKEEKLAALTRIFEIENITRAIIFVKTRVGTSDLVNELIRRGFPAEALNGDLNQQTREQVLNRFRNNQITTLVATDVAARGLDIEDVSHVFNYDLPEDPELYVHRVGRTGRAGKTGIAISLLTIKDRWRLQQIEKFTKQKITRLPIPTTGEIEQHRETQLLEMMMRCLQNDDCRKELRMVGKLVADGYDPLQVAATALRIAAGEEKQRPIAPANEVIETRPARAGRSMTPSKDFKPPKKEHSKGSGASHEDGMVRLKLSMGKAHGIKPGDVVGTIAFHAKFPGSSIGAIRIFDNHTTVDVPQEYVEQTLARSGKCRIRKNAVRLELA